MLGINTMLTVSTSSEVVIVSFWSVHRSILTSGLDSTTVITSTVGCTSKLAVPVVALVSSWMVIVSSVKPLSAMLSVTSSLVVIVSVTNTPAITATNGKSTVPMVSAAKAGRVMPLTVTSSLVVIVSVTKGL